MKKYENYVAALEVLRRAPEQDLSNEFVQSGVIDKFTVQFELGWKLLKRLLAYEGEAVAGTGSPRDIVKAAAALYDFMDEDAWLSMLRDRNKLGTLSQRVMLRTSSPSKLSFDPPART